MDKEIAKKYLAIILSVFASLAIFGMSVQYYQDSMELCSFSSEPPKVIYDYWKERVNNDEKELVITTIIASAIGIYLVNTLNKNKAIKK